MSTTIDPVVLQQLVAQAVRQLQKEGPQAAAPAVPAVHDEYGVFSTMADAIEHRLRLSIRCSSSRRHSGSSGSTSSAGPAWTRRICR